MNTKRHLIISGLVLSGAIFLCLPAGCKTSQNKTALSGKEARMSDELLRSQVLWYRAQAQTEMATMNQLFSQLAPMDAPFTPEVTASIQAAFAQMAPANHPGGIQGYGDSLYQYYLFYEELRKRGADMNGLELDFYGPIQNPCYFPPYQYYSPPPDDIPYPPEIRANADKAFQNS